MRFFDRLKKDMATLGTLQGPRRREFIWDYYKVPILVFFSVLLLVGLSVATGWGRGDIALYAVFINADPEGDSAPLTELMAEADPELSGKVVDVSANYTLRYEGSDASDGETVQVLAALFGIGDLDIFAADRPVFDSYVKQEAFLDLSLFIPREDLDRWELVTYENEGGREVVAGIVLESGSILHQSGYYGGEVVIGAAAQAQNLDPAVAFLKELVQRGPTS